MTGINILLSLKKRRKLRKAEGMIGCGRQCLYKHELREVRHWLQLSMVFKLQWLLQELTGPLGAAVYGYDQGAWQHSDNRAFGPVTSVEHWDQLLTDVGFKKVIIVR